MKLGLNRHVFFFFFFFFLFLRAISTGVRERRVKLSQRDKCRTRTRPSCPSAQELDNIGKVEIRESILFRSPGFNLVKAAFKIVPYWLHQGFEPAARGLPTHLNKTSIREAESLLKFTILMGCSLSWRRILPANASLRVFRVSWMNDFTSTVISGDVEISSSENFCVGIGTIYIRGSHALSLA